MAKVRIYFQEKHKHWFDICSVKRKADVKRRLLGYMEDICRQLWKVAAKQVKLGRGVMSLAHNSTA